MTPAKLTINLTLVLMLGLPATIAGAQDTTGLTAEELALLFAKQKTRGLVIAPSGQGETTAAAPVVETIPVVPDVTYVAVEREDQINIQVAFDFDSASLRDDQKLKLVTLCEVMKTVDVNLFQIVGHTDSSGSAAYNQRLSLLRAEEVKRYFVSDCGIAENRLVAIGVGESTPLDADNPRADINRRVEFQALG